MNDDWRVRVISPATANAVALAKELRSGNIENRLESAAGDRVIVSVESKELFLYAATREQAQAATDAVKALARTAGVTVETELRRWHPVAEEWVDADSPLPDSSEAAAAEHAELIDRERQESTALHSSEWEVRVECPSHRDVVALAQRLREEGIPSLRRWRYLLIGASDEDSARALSQRIEPELPAGSTVTVEASAATVEAELPPNPFAVFGGLGG
jgi:hypothetical protein